MFETFQEEIISRLSGFTHKDICFFAWLCAVRALPFLGVRGSFDYWKRSNKDDRQKNLFAVLRAIDFAALNDDVAYSASHAAYSAYSASRASHKLRAILLDDLENIKAKTNKFQKNRIIYGVSWDNFQSVLRELNCEYWGKWYAQLFEKGFILDKDDLKEIKLRLSVPEEIMELGAADVAKYVLEMKGGVMRLNEARIILLGEAGAGKTSIARRLKDPKADMPDEVLDRTEGVDITSFTLREICSDISVVQDANVYVWDFAGHAITHATHRCFLSERCVYVILYDGRTEGRNRLEYWLNHVRFYGGDSQVFVLVNLRGVHRPDVQENYIRDHYKDQNCKFYYFSIKDDAKELLP